MGHLWPINHLHMDFEGIQDVQKNVIIQRANGRSGVLFNNVFCKVAFSISEQPGKITRSNSAILAIFGVHLMLLCVLTKDCEGN